MTKTSIEITYNQFQIQKIERLEVKDKEKIVMENLSIEQMHAITALLEHLKIVDYHEIWEVCGEP